MAVNGSAPHRLVFLAGGRDNERSHRGEEERIMSAPSVTTGVPPLQHGQRLSRAEFERRYDAMPGLKKAELIDGVVHMPSPVRSDHHATPHAALFGWLWAYWTFTAGVRAQIEPSIRLPGDSEPQPDAMLMIEPSHGGRVVHSTDDYIEGGPELTAEIAASSADHDLGPKKDMYARHGVCEYIVWRVDDGTIDWYVLRSGNYELLVADAAGIIRSETFPGLWLDTTALLGFDLATVLRTLQQGLATPEHAAFVARLQAARVGP
jgi:hypothetical protein